MANSKYTWTLIAIIALILVGMLLQSKYTVFALLPAGEYRSNTDCSFITNVESDSNPSYGDYNTAGAWISVDADGDGILEGYGRKSSVTFGQNCGESSESQLTTTGDGLLVMKDELRTDGEQRIFICNSLTSRSGTIFSTDVAVPEAVLDCDGGTGPVCGNGVCESGETTSSCAADCSTGGGNTIVVPAQPTTQDLIDYAELWLQYN